MLYLKVIYLLNQVIQTSQSIPTLLNQVIYETILGFWTLELAIMLLLYTSNVPHYVLYSGNECVPLGNGNVLLFIMLIMFSIKISTYDANNY